MAIWNQPSPTQHTIQGDHHGSSGVLEPRVSRDHTLSKLLAGRIRKLLLRQVVQLILRVRWVNDYKPFKAQVYGVPE